MDTAHSERKSAQGIVTLGASRHGRRGLWGGGQAGGDVTPGAGVLVG